MGKAKASKIEIDNKGTNHGIMMGTNYGPINNYSIHENGKLPSLISTIVKALGAICFEELDFDEGQSLNAFKPDEKLEYNQVIMYKEIIKDYSIYYTLCSNTLDIYDNSNIGSKSKILKCIKTWYQKAKGKLLLELRDDQRTEIEKIRSNADILIDTVKQKISDLVLESEDLSNTTAEELEIGITCFICYCFMECKILEKPQ